jgi:hypothetical protein
VIVVDFCISEPFFMKGKNEKKKKEDDNILSFALLILTSTTQNSNEIMLFKKCFSLQLLKKPFSHQRISKMIVASFTCNKFHQNNS